VLARAVGDDASGVLENLPELGLVGEALEVARCPGAVSCSTRNRQRGPVPMSGAVSGMVAPTTSR
jgi:hypothetical protein